METNSTCPDSTCEFRNLVTGYCHHNSPCVMVKPKSEKYETRKANVMEGLTKIGYDDILLRIANRLIQPPNDMTAAELSAWLNGYLKCQNDVTEIIGNLKDQYGR